jgi:predicted DNA-binding transcriptional regulator AlpA
MTDNSSPFPADTSDPDGITRYLSHQQFAELLGWHKSTLYHLRAVDGGAWVPDPDVLIDDVAGWSKERIVRWGFSTGVLLEDGSVNPDYERPPGGLPRPDLRTEWRTNTVRYLSQAQCGKTLGISGMAVYFLRRRGEGTWGNFIPAAVVVGTIYGWDKDAVVEFGKRTGRLQPDGSIVDKQAS